MLSLFDYLNLARYLAAVRIDGDVRNDWLTHLDPTVTALAQRLAHYLFGG